MVLSLKLFKIDCLKGATIKCTGQGFLSSHFANPKKQLSNLLVPSILIIISQTVCFLSIGLRYL
jgi:hypothetical protein